MIRRPVSRFRSVRLLLLAALLPLAGCVGYQLGTSLPSQYKSVAVLGFDNRTDEPNLEFAATQSTLQEFQRDGSLAVTDPGSADLILEVTLREVRFEAVRFDEGRTRGGEEYRMTLEAEAMLTDRRSGQPLFAKRKIQGETTFPSQGDSLQARLSAQPGVARDLAHQIVKNVVEFW